MSLLTTHITQDVKSVSFYKRNDNVNLIRIIKEKEKNYIWKHKKYVLYYMYRGSLKFKFEEWKML